MTTAQLVSDSNSGVLQTSNAQLLEISHPNYYNEGPQEPQVQEQQQQQGQPQFDPAALQQYLQSQQPPQPQGQQPPPKPPVPLDPAFVAQFEQVTGIKPEQFGQAVQQFQQMQQSFAQQQAQQQMTTLRQEWGAEFDTVMPEISKRFAALPPQMQAGLDNIDGARLIYAQVMQERAAQGTQVPYAQPPRYDRPSVPQNLQRQQEPQFTKDQIRNMSESEYSKNQSAIAYAFANGLVR
jgi:hypothetical protein